MLCIKYNVSNMRYWKHITALTLVIGLIFLLVPQRTYGAMAYIQSQSGRNFSSATTDLSFDSNVTAGSIIFGGVHSFDNTSSITSVAKLSGTATIGTVTLVNNPTTETNYGVACMWWAIVTGTGSLTMRATISAATGVSLSIAEASGVDTSSPFLASAMRGETNPGPGTDILTSGSLGLTTSDGDFLFGYFANVSSEGTTYSLGTGFSLAINKDETWFLEYRTTSGSVATASQTNNFADFISGAMAFKQAGGPTGPFHKFVFGGNTKVILNNEKFIFK